jgi:hypothetical protein
MLSSGNGDTLLYAKLQFLEPLWNLVNDLSLDGLPASSRHELHFDGVLPEVGIGLVEDALKRTWLSATAS